MYKFLLNILILCIVSIIHCLCMSYIQSFHFLLRLCKCLDTLYITLSCSIESSYMKMFCSCVGDGLLTRISALYKPSEIENLSDCAQPLCPPVHARIRPQPSQSRWRILLTKSPSFFDREVVLCKLKLKTALFTLTKSSVANPQVHLGMNHFVGLNLSSSATTVFGKWIYHGQF